MTRPVLPNGMLACEPAPLPASPPPPEPIPPVPPAPAPAPEPMYVSPLSKYLAMVRAEAFAAGVVWADEMRPENAADAALAYAESKR